MNKDLYAASNSARISNLGKRFAENRKRKGYTQKEVSEQIGLSVFTISSFESDALLVRIYNAFVALEKCAFYCFETLRRSMSKVEMLQIVASGEIEKLLPELPISTKDRV